MTKYWLNNFAIDDFIISALKEDMYYGDITTDAICANLDNKEFNIALKTRNDGVLCGRSVFERVFKLLCASTFLFLRKIMKQTYLFELDESYIRWTTIYRKL